MPSLPHQQAESRGTRFLNSLQILSYRQEAPPDALRSPLEKALNESHSLFPDLQIVGEDQVAEADKVVTRWTFYGTNTGDFETPAPLPATGKKVAFTGMNIYRFAGGKIVEEWFQEDTMGMLRQLGFMPEAE